MKKKIYTITESQYGTLQKFLKNRLDEKLNETKNKQLTEGLLNRNKSSETFSLNDGKYCAPLSDCSDLEFCERIIGSIKSLYGDNDDAQFDRYDLPSWLSDMGMSTSKYKEMLIGNGLITLCDDGNGTFTHKVVKKGIMKNLLNLKKSMLDLNTPDEPQVEVELNEYDYKDAVSSENSVESQDIDYSDDEITEILVNDQYVLGRLSTGGLVFFDGNDITDINTLKQEYSELTTTNDVNTFVNDVNTALEVTPENINALIEELFNLGYDDSDNLIKGIRNNVQMSEMTTTGSVGGQYETPVCWSKNPLKGAFAQKPTMNGGEFVKKKNEIV